MAGGEDQPHLAARWYPLSRVIGTSQAGPLGSWPLRRRHERAIREIIVEGVSARVFRVKDPFLASFGILEMCVSVARWFDPMGALSAEQVASDYDGTSTAARSL